MSDLTPNGGGPDGSAPSETPPVQAQPIAETADNSTPARRAERTPAKRTAPRVVVRYGVLRQIGEFTHNLASQPAVGTKVVARTERGVEIAEVLTAICDHNGWGCVTREHLAKFCRAAGNDYPLRRDGKVLRLANRQDLIDARHLDSSAREEGAYCRQQIRERKLKMRMVTVEHLLGGERIIFYFTAESRVDFRELVSGLASQYRTRIEMRQIGARDEARLVADYERCGQQCCCQRYLKHLKPVSMRMAKVQKATLDPLKISGRCGRLMCCLRYEDATYEQLRKHLPKKNTYIRTASCVGKVVDSQILTQLVRVQLSDGKMAVVAVEEITERDVPSPAERTQTPAPAKPKPPPARSEKRLLRNEEADGAPVQAEPAPQPPAAASPSPPGGTSSGASGPSQRRRRRRKKNRDSQNTPAQSAGQAPSAQPAQGQPKSAGQNTSARKRRGRRGRKRKR